MEASLIFWLSLKLCGIYHQKLRVTIFQLTIRLGLFLCWWKHRIGNHLTYKKVSYSVIRVIHFSRFWETYQKAFTKSYQTTLSNYTCYSTTSAPVYSHSKLRKWNHCTVNFNSPQPIQSCWLKILVFLTCLKHFFFHLGFRYH